jgi:hypothetical protein
MPATTVPFLVLDEESGFPVPGANAYVFYEDPIVRKRPEVRSLLMRRVAD